MISCLICSIVKGAKALCLALTMINSISNNEPEIDIMSVPEFEQTYDIPFLHSSNDDIEEFKNIEEFEKGSNNENFVVNSVSDVDLESVNTRLEHIIKLLQYIMLFQIIVFSFPLICSWSKKNVKGGD